jgi:hypothetical protein
LTIPEPRGTKALLGPRRFTGVDIARCPERKGSAVPETNTVTVEDVEGVFDWARQNASPADRAKISAIIEAHGRDKERQFPNQPTLWEIDWFYRDSEIEFYRMALVNPETLQELWGSA